MYNDSKNNIKKPNIQMPPSLPLLLKLTAASLTGAVALLSFRLLGRNGTLSSQLRDTRDSLIRNATCGGGPPTILVMGFKSHGKSAFVNTACRVLAGEDGILVIRAETAPHGPTSSATRAHRLFRATLLDADAYGEEYEEEEGDLAVDLVDSPSLPEAGELTRDDVEVALSHLPVPECAVLVLRSPGSVAKMRKLPEIAGVVREKGLPLVVVLTHMKALKNKKQAEELRKEVAFRARTDCVYFIENYTAGGTFDAHDLVRFRNNFNTHSTILAIIRQCIEFTTVRRSYQSLLKTNGATSNQFH